MPPLLLPFRVSSRRTVLEKMSGRFTIATGRARPTFAAYAQCVPINAPVILSNGSALYDFAATLVMIASGTM